MQVTKSAPIFSWKCTKSVWWSGSARTRWGSLQHSPDLLAGFKKRHIVKGLGEGKRQEEGEKGRNVTAEGGEGRREQMEGRGEWREMERNLAPMVISKSWSLVLWGWRWKGWTSSLWSCMFVLWSFCVCSVLHGLQTELWPQRRVPATKRVCFKRLESRGRSWCAGVPSEPQLHRTWWKHRLLGYMQFALTLLVGDSLCFNNWPKYTFTWSILENVVHFNTNWKQ